MKTRTKGFIVIAIAILLYVIYLLCNNTLLGRLYWYKINIYTGNLRLTDHYRERSGTNNIDWIVADSKDTKLFLGHVNTQDATKYINDKVYLLNALYVPTESPYPEVITNIIDCSAEFKPVKQDLGHGLGYKLFAGERFGYGICTKDLIKYDSYYGLFDCKSKGVFEIKLFSSGGNGEIEKIIKSFGCNN